MQNQPPQQLPNFCSKFLTWSHSLTEHSPRAPPDFPAHTEQFYLVLLHFPCWQGLMTKIPLKHKCQCALTKHFTQSWEYLHWVTTNCQAINFLTTSKVKLWKICLTFFILNSYFKNKIKKKWSMNLGFPLSTVTVYKADAKKLLVIDLLWHSLKLTIYMFKPPTGINFYDSKNCCA